MVGRGSSWAGWLRQVNGVSMMDADRRLKTQDPRSKTDVRGRKTENRGRTADKRCWVLVRWLVLSREGPKDYRTLQKVERGGVYMVGWGSSWAGWLRQVNGVSMMDADRRLKTQDRRQRTDDGGQTTQDSRPQTQDRYSARYGLIFRLGVEGRPFGCAQDFWVFFVGFSG